MCEKCLWYESPVWFSHFAQDECLLEPELYERAEKLFRVLLRYVTEFLVWEETLELSAELQPRYGLSDQMQMHKSTCKALNLTFNSVFLHPCRTKDNAYYCVLYNDEHHSYDHVIYTLQRSVNCNEAEAQTHTALIDKEVFFGFVCLFLYNTVMPKGSWFKSVSIIALIISIADYAIM